MPSRSFVAIRMELSPSDSKPNDVIQSWRYVEIVDEMIKVKDDLWMPKVSRFIKFLSLKGREKEVWSVAGRTSVLSIKVDEPVSPEVFTLPLPLHTRVAVSGGTKANDNYFVGGAIDEQVIATGSEQKITKDAPAQENYE